MEIHLKDLQYPALLKQISSPPPMLFSHGELLEADQFSVAIVGSRNATLYGLRVAEQLAFELAEKGITIVSGLAKGIDTAAHRGALKAGGRTIAVLGAGLDMIYPKENKELAEKISGQGCLLTEYPPGTHPAPFNFPIRNRIISGLSLGVIVVEASRRSGSLITAAHALEQGRNVYAVPGPVDSLLSEGAHALIKQGAMLIDCAENVLVDLFPTLRSMRGGVGEGREGACGSTDEGDPIEQEILKILAARPQQVSELACALSSGGNGLDGALLQLEVKGKVRRLPGAFYAAC